MKPLKTTSFRIANYKWIELGGSINPIRGTGEIRYDHPAYLCPVRVNARRSGIPAIMISRINQLLRLREAANDAVY